MRAEKSKGHVPQRRKLRTYEKRQSSLGAWSVIDFTKPELLPRARNRSDVGYPATEKDARRHLRHAPKEIALLGGRDLPRSRELL